MSDESLVDVSYLSSRRCLWRFFFFFETERAKIVYEGATDLEGRESKCLCYMRLLCAPAEFVVARMKRVITDRGERIC